MPRELWAVRGPYWALPLAVDWIEQTDSANVRAGIPLLDIQRDILFQTLQAAGAERIQGRWTITRARLDVVASKEDCPNPELLVEWNPAYRIRFRKPWRQADGEDRKNRDEFFHEFVKLGLVRSALSAEVIFFAFCRHMLHWLVNERKVVDLGFCKLHSLPFRPQWKELLRAVKPTQDWYRNPLVRPELRMYQTKGKGGKNYGPLDGHHCLWTIDVEHCAPWWNESNRHEAAKRQRDKRSFEGYLMNLGRFIRRNQKRIQRIYDSYLSIIRRPYVVSYPARNNRSVLSNYCRTKPSTLAANPEPLDLPPAYDSRTGQAVDPLEHDATEEMGTVPGMSPVQSHSGDVRDSRPEVDEPANRA